MDDLVPFLVFIIIALVNFAKFVLEKRGRKAPGKTGPPPRKAQHPSIEKFFEDIAEKFEPQPVELPGWPESREKPDYISEMETFERSAVDELKEEEEVVAPVPEPPPQATPIMSIMEKADPLKKGGLPSSSLSGMQGIRLPSAPMLRSRGTGGIDVDLRGREKLRQAIVANLIFSPPRAYDREFNNTIAK